MTACPSRQELTSLLREELPDANARKLALHVEACALCQSILDKITSDTLEDERLTPQLSPDSPSGGVLSELMLRLSNSPPGSVSAASSEANSWLISFPGPPTLDAPLGQLDEYSILDRIADGGHGVVFRAIDNRLGRQVAIKVLRTSSEDSRTRLQREARAAAALKNDHIVTVYKSGTRSDFPPYLVMEYVEGESLADRIRREGPLLPRDAARIVHEAALGISSAQQLGLVHRDIKPSNILLDSSNGRARITDFGLVRDKEDESLLTIEGAIAGTPSYMSPEQVTEPKSVDGRSDVYSLGVVLYELLTGVVPFRGVLRMTLLQVAHDEPQPPRHYNDAVPRDLQIICLKAMSKDREQRYRTGQELADDLQRWLEGEPIQARPLTRTSRLLRWCRRNPSIAGLSLCVVMLLLMLTVGSLGVAAKLSRIADAERQNAEVARIQRNVMINTLGKLIFQLQEDFEDDDVDYDLLQQLALEIALDGLRNIDFSESMGDDVDYQLAAGYRKMGEIYDRLDGREDDAARARARAVEILEVKSAEGLATDRNLSLLVRLAWDQGEHEVGLENYKNALKHYRQALTICESQQQSGKSSADWSRRLAVSHVRVAELRMLTSSFEESKQHIVKAIAIHSQVQGAESVEEAELDEFELRQMLAQVELKLGQLESARTHFAANVVAANQLVASNPRDYSSYRYLFVAQEGLAEIHRLANRPALEAESLDRIDKAESRIYKSIENPSGDDLLDIFNLYMTVEWDYNLVGDIPRELKYNERRCRFLEKWVDHFPTDSLGQVDLGISYEHLAEMRRELGEVEEAAELLKVAIGLYSKLPPTDPNSSVNAPWLLQALLDAAEVQTELGNLEAAEEYKQSARANLELLENRMPSETLQDARRTLTELEN